MTTAPPGRAPAENRTAAGVDPERLRAVTRALDDDRRVDPLVVGGTGDGVLFSASDLVLAGRGVALRLSLAGGLAAGPAAVRRLAAVPCEDPLGRPGTGVVAQGALPFDPGADGQLVVPSVTFGQDRTGRWVTVVAEVGSEPPDWRALVESVPAAGPPSAEPGLPTLDFRPPPEGYRAAVAAALQAIGEGRLAKVVMARGVRARFTGPIDPLAAARRLADQEPACTLFSHPLGEARFLGASPELLVSRRDTRVYSSPVAGTIGLGQLPDGDEGERLLGSEKDRIEHQLVVDEITGALSRRGAVLDVPAGPQLMRLHSVAHLLTPIAGRFGADDRAPDVLTLLGDLHPTPAVGGVPRPVALELIDRLEEAPRGPWAGPVGWVDGAGDGDWVIGIRSALLDRAVAQLWAGAGIVAGSDPTAELAETSLKLVPVLEALAPGSAALLSR